MKLSEIVTDLINIGVIHQVGEEYFLTDKLEEMAKAERSTILLAVDEPEIDLNRLYPETIRKASNSKKVLAVQDYCEVPQSRSTGSGTFLLRSNDNITQAKILKILRDKTLEPKIVLACIKDYYKTIDFPKAFKRFIAEDFDSMYSHHAKGKKLDTDELPDNKQWQ